MAYFDAGSGYDTQLLSDAAQGHVRVRPVAAEIEREIVDRYTDLLRRRPIGEDYSEVFELADGVRGVFLRGYDSTIADADGYNADRSLWTGFAAAMRSVIASLISHRILHFDADPGVVSETRGARSVTRRGPVNKKWPVGWDEPLRLYDLRPAVYHL